MIDVANENDHYCFICSTFHLNVASHITKLVTMMELHSLTARCHSFVFLLDTWGFIVENVQHRHFLWTMGPGVNKKNTCWERARAISRLLFRQWDQRGLWLAGPQPIRGRVVEIGRQVDVFRSRIDDFLFSSGNCWTFSSTWFPTDFL